MDLFTFLLWIITSICFILSLIKNREKTFDSARTARTMIKGIAGEIVAIVFLIGLILTFIPPEAIKHYLGETNLFISTLAAASVGSITLIPAFVAFPLVGSIIDVGASIIPAVAFLTTLTMVGVVTFPLETQEFGLKFTLSRNILSFVFAMVIALVMGVLA